MVHILLQCGFLVSLFVELPLFHVLSIVESETVISMVLRAKERFSSIKRTLSLQQQLFLFLFTRVAVGTAYRPRTLAVQYAPSSASCTCNIVRSFNHNDPLTRTWHDHTSLIQGRWQTVREFLRLQSRAQNPCRSPLCSPQSVIVIKVSLDWRKPIWFLIPVGCLVLLAGSVGRNAKSISRFVLVLSLIIFSLACYMYRWQRGTFWGMVDHRTDSEKARLPTLSHGSDNRIPARRNYTVGLICALPIELAAVGVMLDEIHADLPIPRSDTNTYKLGRMSSHNVVITCLPSGIEGSVTAATAAAQMLSTFPSIRFGLMVGIGGGVPNLPTQDIRLGDVVIGNPTRSSGGVFQYDVEFERTGTLNKPPFVLLNALSSIRARHLMYGNRIPELLDDMLDRYPLMRNSITPGVPDRLFRAHYEHANTNTNTCAPSPCNHCSSDFLIPRPQRPRGTAPQIHYGRIASVTQVVRNATLRDRVSRKLGNLCFEMEAAGLMDSFPCLVVRGISDYADSHKNDHWQGYAAATAAACVKELLEVIPPEEGGDERALLLEMEAC